MEPITNVLTAQDLGMLIEAMDAWVKKGDASELIGGMLTAAFAKSEGDFDRMMADREKNNLAKSLEKEQRQESATMLKAKLIQLRRSI